MKSEAGGDTERILSAKCLRATGDTHRAMNEPHTYPLELPERSMSEQRTRKPSSEIATKKSSAAPRYERLRVCTRGVSVVPVTPHRPGKGPPP